MISEMISTITSETAHTKDSAIDEVSDDAFNFEKTDHRRSSGQKKLFLIFYHYTTVIYKRRN
jgi:hypothetical protein